MQLLGNSFRRKPFAGIRVRGAGLADGWLCLKHERAFLKTVFSHVKIQFLKTRARTRALLEQRLSRRVRALF